jgi:hypothetical protein
MRASALRAPSVSADGTQIAFHASDARGLAVMGAPTTGGEPREIYRVPDDKGFTRTGWTHDGRHVLATRIARDRGEFWWLPLDGSEPQKTDLPFRPIEQFTVSPDGTQIAMVGGRRESEIWVMTGLLKETKPTPKK